jgi:hypothetical protein
MNPRSGARLAAVPALPEAWDWLLWAALLVACGVSVSGFAQDECILPPIGEPFLSYGPTSLRSPTPAPIDSLPPAFDADICGRI